MEDDSQNQFLWQYDYEDLDFSTPVPVDVEGGHGSLQNSLGQSSAISQPLTGANCPPYALKWALCIMKKKLQTLATDTIQNIELYPSIFWQTELKNLIDSAIAAESLNETHIPSKTQVNFTITERGVRPIELYFPKHHISWDKVDKQIREWADLVSTRGRVLSVKVLFIFKANTSPEAQSKPPRRGGPATNRHFADRAHLQNNPETAGSYRRWEAVVSILDCPGQCNIGPYCWEDPEDKKRYPVDRTIIEDLVDIVVKGRPFNCHADMPPHLVERLRKGSKTVTKRKEAPAIHITNVLPGGLPSPTKRAKIPGKLETVIRSHRDRLASQTNDAEWIREIDAIAEFTRKQRFNLNNFTKKHIQYFVSNKFPLGLATQWVMDVDDWRKELEEQQVEDIS